MLRYVQRQSYSYRANKKLFHIHKGIHICNSLDVQDSLYVLLLMSHDSLFYLFFCPLLFLTSHFLSGHKKSAKLWIYLQLDALCPWPLFVISSFQRSKCLSAFGFNPFVDGFLLWNLGYFLLFCLKITKK